MANKTIFQVYQANPTTTLLGSSLIYLGLSPYDGSSDSAILASNIFPASSTANAIVKFANTSGTSFLNSGVIIDNSNNVTGIATITSTNAVVASLTTNQLIMANSGVLTSVSNLALFIIGTSNQVIVTNGTGAGAGQVTLSLPQNIALSSSPTFVGLTLTGLTATKLVQSNAGNILQSVSALGAFILAGANVTVTDNGNGTVTISSSGGGSGFTGTPGSIPFCNTDGTLTQDNTNLFWNKASAGLRIGTGGITITSLTASQLVGTNSSKLLVSIGSLGPYILAGTNIIVTDNFNGTVTIATTLTPTFTNATLTGLTASKLMQSDPSKITVSCLSLGTFILGSASVTVTDNHDGTVTLTSIGGSGFVGTAGSIPFCDNVTGALTQNNAHLFWSQAANVLGIGTNAPDPYCNIESKANNNTVNLLLSGTHTFVSESNMAALRVISTFAPASSMVSIEGININPTINVPGGVTVPFYYSLLINSGTFTGTPPTQAYSLWISAPACSGGQAIYSGGPQTFANVTTFTGLASLSTQQWQLSAPFITANPYQMSNTDFIIQYQPLSSPPTKNIVILPPESSVVYGQIFIILDQTSIASVNNISIVAYEQQSVVLYSITDNMGSAWLFWNGIHWLLINYSNGHH